MNAIIVTGGDIDLSFLKSYIIEREDTVIISVDAAITKLESINIVPNIMVGDFDTLSDEIRLKRYESLGVEIIRHDPIKDFSDTELAIDKAVQDNIKDIVIVGALGRRFDHAFANILILQKYKKYGVNITIYDKYNKIYIKSNSFTLNKGDLWGKYISLFSLKGEVVVESIKGVAYPVEKRMLDSIKAPSLYISNELTDERLEAKFDGDLLVVESRD